MAKNATGSFEVKAWKEEPHAEWDGGVKLTRARVEQAYSGAIVGTSTIEYLMVYWTEQKAHFVGYERITGAIDGRSGSVVMRHEGTFESGIAASRSLIVAGSGAGGLAGIEGHGSYVAGHEGAVPYELSYTFA